MIFIFIKTESFEKASSKCFVRVDLFNTHLIAEYIHPNNVCNSYTINTVYCCDLSNPPKK